MIRPTHCHCMAVWAAREVQRRPGRSILLFAALFSLVFLVATALFFTQALDTTWANLVERAPDLVVRRIDAGGWAPIPVDTAVARARRVPGVLDPTPRLWGVAAGPDGPVTVVASPGVIPDEMLEGLAPPSSGQAVVGPQVARQMDADGIELNAVKPLRLHVVGTFPASTDLVTRDVVWLSPDDARQLLGLSSNQASDLAVHLFRREEQQAIQADLAAAFPWPVRIIDRRTSALRHHSRATRIGGLAVVMCIPALLAMLLIITGTAAAGRGHRYRWGLFQSMGWTPRDLVHLQMASALIVGTPALLGGLASAYAAVFYPPAAGMIAHWILGGQQPSALTLNTGGVLVTMLEISAMIGIPYLAAVFLTCLRNASGDPWTLLQADPWT